VKRSSNLRLAAIATVLGTVCAAALSSQTTPAKDAAERRIALEKLTVVGSALYISAHPDDENTALLAWLAKGRKVRTGYLSITRGDGGQNLIGTEQGDLLGVIRTEELLAARRIDGAEQFFTRAVDFGYSKTPEETLRIWGREAVLADVVWVVRNFRPDVIITRFPANGDGGHGHHTASAILAADAFSAAGDPKRFPEQLAYVKPWQARRLLWNAWRRLGEERPATAPPQLAVDLGAWDPLLGESYAELAAASRSMHKSQGFGSSPRRGSVPNYFELVAGEPVSKDVFDGIDLTWRRVPGGEVVGKLLSNALAAYSDEDPAASVPALLRALAALDGLERDSWVVVKRRELLEAIRVCTGLWLEAMSKNATASPGSSVDVTAVALNRSNVPMTLVRVVMPHFSPRLYMDRPDAAKTPMIGGGTRDPMMPLVNNQPVTMEFALLKLPADEPYSQPYWLAAPHDIGEYTVRNQALVGLPHGSPAIAATFVLRAGEQELVYDVPVMNRWTDPVAGERTRELAVVPRVTVNLEAPVLIFPDRTRKVIRALVRAHEPKTSATVRLAAPPGWRVEPQGIPVTFEARDEERTLRFAVTPPEAQGTGELVALVRSAAGEEPARSLVEVDHRHIPPQILLPPAAARLVRVDVARPVKRVGYVMGSGDEIPAILRQLGFEVTLLSDDDLEEQNLLAFDTIVVGVRAYNTRPRLAEAQERLLAYVDGGGTLVVQYNTNRDVVTERLGPYPFTLSRERVTDEAAPVKILVPASPLLTYPHTVVTKDFEGWVQERGLYFPEKWDPRYQAVLAMSDPGEPTSEGALLLATSGKGSYVYTGLAFFRQLPAGVPGAIRLFVNLLAGGRARA
jgi:LmbE family N-acetylglucosaminyl deacetylase